MESTSILPGGLMAEAHSAGGNPRAPKAKTASPDQSQTEATVDIATDNRIGFGPLLRELLREAAKDLLGLHTKETITGGHKRDKMPTLSQTSIEILALLSPLRGLESSKRITMAVGFSIEVGNLDINNAISSTGEETTEEKVTTGVQTASLNSRVLSMTRADARFVTNSRRSEGLGCEVTKLITDLIMPKQNKATFLAGESMTFAKGATAAITKGGQARWRQTIAKVKPIPKLLGRKAGAIFRHGHHRQELPSVGSSESGTTHSRRQRSLELNKGSCVKRLAPG